MTKKMTKRQLQAIATKKKIYDAAMALMDKNGFDNTTIEEISQAAGVSIGAFYHYYKSKDEIYVELFKICDLYFEETVEPLLNGLDTPSKIILFFKHYGMYTMGRGLDAISQLYHTKNYHFLHPDSYMHILLQKIIEEGQNNGSLINGMSPIEAEKYFFIQARGLIFDWCLHEADYNLEERMTEMITFSLKSFLQDVTDTIGYKHIH